MFARLSSRASSGGSVPRHVLREFNASFSIDFEIVYCSPLAPVPPSFWTSFRSIMCGCATKLCCVQDARRMRFLTATVVAAAVALAGCTSDGRPPSTGDSGSVGSFVRNLFRSKSEDQPPGPHKHVPAVASNEAPLGAFAPSRAVHTEDEIWDIQA